MSGYHARIEWRRGNAAFNDGRYHRVHRWSFDGGASIAASASPHHVKAPMSDAALVDPEEAFVAAIASCHMLFFLSFAAKLGFVVDRYVDEATGTMRPGERGLLYVAEVVLDPHVEFGGPTYPDDHDVASMHGESHRQCFIANSVRTVVTVAGSWRASTDAAASD